MYQFFCCVQLKKNIDEMQLHGEFEWYLKVFCHGPVAVYNFSMNAS